MDMIKMEQLRQVPYLDLDRIDGRTVGLLTLWDGKEWQTWLPLANGTLSRLRPNDVAQTTYLAKVPASPTDAHFPFIEFMWQHASWPEISPQLLGIAVDVQNLATALAKIEHLFVTREMLGLGITQFVATDLEYLCTTCRSLFDLLQEVVAGIWETVRLFEPLAKKRKLPKSFGDVVLSGGKPRSADEIQTRYGLPTPLADFYSESSTFFLQLRDWRDAVVHGGKSTEHIFCTEKGFCVSPRARPFSGFPGWNEAHRYNENLVALSPFLAHVVFGTLSACARFVGAVTPHIEFPPAIAPGYNVFMRMYNSEALLAVQEILKGASPWSPLRHTPYTNAAASPGGT